MTLDEIIKARGLTIYEVAKQSGYCMSGCYRLARQERNINTISMSTLVKLASVLTNGDVNRLLKLLNEDNKIKE